MIHSPHFCCPDLKQKKIKITHSDSPFEDVPSCAFSPQSLKKLVSGIFVLKI